MAPENIFKKVWLEQDFTMDTREILQKAIHHRARSAAQGLIRAFIRGIFDRAVGGLELMDDFDGGARDNSPGVLKIERGYEFGLCTREMFAGGERLLLILELPRENYPGLFDMELDLKVGLANILRDNWNNPTVNSTVLNNRLRFIAEPKAYRLTSQSTSAELARVVKEQLEEAIAQGTSIAAA
jgi:hypothetical protein